MEKTESQLFLDELLEEIEFRERKMNEAYADLVLSEIRDLETAITKTFSTAEQEKQIIQEWAIKKSTKLTERKEWLERKLEYYLLEQGVKTIDLPNGRIQKRKTPERIEIVDLDLFLSKATEDLLSVTPQTYKPDLTKIKNFYQMTKKVPAGTRLIESTEKFSVKVKHNGELSNGETET